MFRHIVHEDLSRIGKTFFNNPIPPIEIFRASCAAADASWSPFQLQKQAVHLHPEIKAIGAPALFPSGLCGENACPWWSVWGKKPERREFKSQDITSRIADLVALVMMLEPRPTTQFLETQDPSTVKGVDQEKNVAVSPRHRGTPSSWKQIGIVRARWSKPPMRSTKSWSSVFQKSNTPDSPAGPNRQGPATFGPLLKISEIVVDGSTNATGCSFSTRSKPSVTNTGTDVT